MKKLTVIFISSFSIFVLFFAFILLNKGNISTMVTKIISDSNNTPTIIIDAGHGGMDGGAIAADGTYEKDINLSIALKLNELFSVNGFKTIMIRTEDISIYDSSAKTVKAQKTSDLHNRMKIMKENPDAIFISIHQNHYEQESSHGAQVFYSTNTPESKTLAQCIQQNIINRVQPENTRLIKPTTSDLYLLHKTNSIAVLVECGFISNIEENKKLKNDEYQSRIAFSIFCGLLDFLIS